MEFDKPFPFNIIYNEDKIFLEFKPIPNYTKILSIEINQGKIKAENPEILVKKK